MKSNLEVLYHESKFDNEYVYLIIMQIDVDIDIEEMTARISSGLKTWVNFGITVACGVQAAFEPTPHAETHCQLKKIWNEQSVKLGKRIKVNGQLV